MSDLRQATHAQAITLKLEQAQKHLRAVEGDNPTDVVIAAMSVAQAFTTCALVAAVQELTDEIRKQREGR